MSVPGLRHPRTGGGSRHLERSPTVRIKPGFLAWSSLSAMLLSLTVISGCNDEGGAPSSPPPSSGPMTPPPTPIQKEAPKPATPPTPSTEAKAPEAKPAETKAPEAKPADAKPKS